MAEQAVGATGEVAGDADGDRERPVAPATGASTVKPIPPAKEAQVAGAAAAADQPRGPDGKFLPAAPPADGGIPDKDYPTVHLEGMPDERKQAPQPKPAAKGKSQLRGAVERAARPDGITASGVAVPSLIEPGSAMAQEQEAAAAKGAPADPNAPPAIVPKPGEDGKPEAPAPAKYTVKTRARNERGEHIRRADGSYEMETHEFDSEQAFHENWRTLRGMHRAETVKSKNFEQMARANHQAATEWKTLAEAYERGERVPQGRVPQGQPAAGGGAQDAISTPDAPENEIIRQFNWKEYRQVAAQARAAEERGELAEGEADMLIEAYRVRETARLVRAELTKHVDSRFEQAEAPAKRVEQWKGHAVEITKNVERFATDMIYADGTPAYPELSDPEVKQELGTLIAHEVQAYVAEGIDEDAAWKLVKSDKGLHKSILLWRDWRRATNRPWSAGGNGRAPSAPAPAPSAPAPAPSGNGGVDSAMRSIVERNAAVVTGGSMPARAVPAGKTPAHTLHQALLASGGNTLGNFGWPE